ncbi:MAG: diacylglycerol kinase [Hyphomicrobiales bacterium]|jgi:dihydrofolate reductase|nr:diacylglycerol kinase [Hyphomicrobiales bacterium]
MTPDAIPLVLVAAVGRNGVIGGEGTLPWRLPSDLRRFKARTMGKPLLMGRKTFASIGRPLPGRETIVLTRDPGFAPPGIYVVGDLAAALELAQARARAMGAKEIIVAGGGDLYAQTIGLAQRLDVTEIDLEPAGDAFFPFVDPALWRETLREPHPAGPGDDASFTVVAHERR